MTAHDLPTATGPTKFRKKPIVIEATQWFKNGDHPDDGDERFTTGEYDGERCEGKVVRYYRHPQVSGEKPCEHCGRKMHDHGWIDTLEGGHIVCPGDFVITGIKGERYPCKPDIFEATYELARVPTGSGSVEGAADEIVEWMTREARPAREYVQGVLAILRRHFPAPANNIEGVTKDASGRHATFEDWRKDEADDPFRNNIEGASDWIARKAEECVAAMQEAAGDVQFWRERFTAILRDVPKALTCCDGKYGTHVLGCAGPESQPVPANIEGALRAKIAEWRKAAGFHVTHERDVRQTCADELEQLLSAPSPAGGHPEDRCEKCGGPNIVWFVASPLWNTYVRSKGHPEIICPLCFAKLAEAAGYGPTAWELVPENPPDVTCKECGQSINPPADVGNECRCKTCGQNTVHDEPASGEASVSERRCYIQPSVFSGHDGEFFIGSTHGYTLTRSVKWARPDDPVDYWPDRASALAFIEQHRDKPAAPLPEQAGVAIEEPFLACNVHYASEPRGTTCIDLMQRAAAGEGRMTEKWRRIVASGAELCSVCRAVLLIAQLRRELELEREDREDFEGQLACSLDILDVNAPIPSRSALLIATNKRRAELSAAVKGREEAEKERDELREAISPGRTCDQSYYVKVAAKMRERETKIKPMG